MTKPRNKCTQPIPTGDSSRWRLLIAGAIAIALLTLIAYIPAMRAGFIWDDERQVLGNSLITAPLTHLMFRLEHALWGFNPAGYHVVNVLLHILNALLLWWLLRRLKLPGAWLAAAIWAVHPVNVESAAWITEATNTLSTALFLGTLLLSLRFMDTDRRDWWKYYIPGLIIYALALSAKSTACVLPAALIAVHWLSRRKVRWREALLITPFVLMGVAMGEVSIWWEVHHQGTHDLGIYLSSADRLLIAGRALWFYLAKLILPVSLTFSYPQWDIHGHAVAQYVWPAAWMLFIAVLWRLRKSLGNRPLLAFVFFTVMLSPMLGFIDLDTFRYTYVADHYQYIACIGPIALFAAFISTCKLNQQARRAIAASVLTVLTVLTWRQSMVYTNSETLWRDVLAKNRNSWLAHVNLANLLDHRGDTDEAMPHYRRAVKLNPYYAEGQVDLGDALVRQGKPDEAIEHYAMALSIAPTWPDAHYDMGIALGKQGKVLDAIGQYQQAVMLNRHYVDAYNSLGVALVEAGKLPGAIQYLRTGLAVSPTDGHLHSNLAVALYYKGDYAGAWREAGLASHHGVEPNPAFIEALSKKMPR
jgi:protein O-mannosyl-transferase